MLSRGFLGTLAADWAQPVLIVLSLLIAFALLRMTIRLVDLEREMRRAAAADKDSGEEAANAAFFRMRRKTLVRIILLLMLFLFFAAFPVVKSWYGLE